MAERARPKPSLRVLSLVLFSAVALYIALYPRLKQMSEDAARINREVDRQQGDTADPTPTSEIDRLHAMVQADPSNAAAQLEFALKLRDVGRYMEAESAAQAAARLKAEEPGPLLALADIQHRARRYDLAIGSYRKVMETFPNHPDAAAALGWLYISLGWNSEARDLLAPAATANPDDTRLQAALSLAHLQATDLTKAEAILLKLKQDHPNDPNLWGPLVDVYIKAKQLKDARAIAQEALRLKPGDVKLSNGLGQAQYDSGDHDEAAATFRRVLQIEPDNLFARQRLGLCLKAAGSAKEAIRELEAVYRLSPGFEQTPLILGQLYVQSGRTEEGQRLLKEFSDGQARAQRFVKAGYLLAARKPTADAHFRLAMSYREMDEKPKMIAELTRTLELKPDHELAQRMLTEALRERAQPLKP